MYETELAVSVWQHELNEQLSGRWTATASSGAGTVRYGTGNTPGEAVANAVTAVVEFESVRVAA
jgi:hypothetical protein